jgi:hypothetical protein
MPASLWLRMRTAAVSRGGSLGGYGRGNVYDKIWQGKWEEYDLREASRRVPVTSDLYDGAGACSVFHTFQGWPSHVPYGAQ